MKCFLFSILFGLFVNINSSFSQCKDFALTNCKPKLAGYAYNGNYTSFLLKEEEKVELHKAFFSGQKYRVVVGCQDSLPRVHFCIVDLDKNLIFDNKGSDYADYFDFELDEAMN